MKANRLSALVLAAAVAAASAMPAALADDPADNGACPDRSLLINDSSASVRRLDVALRIVWGNIGMAAGQGKTIDTALFLADAAARYSIKPECLKPWLRNHRAEIVAAQGRETAVCPAFPTDEFSLRALSTCGMKIYGCHLCIADMIAPRCGKLINADGSVNADVWERAVIDEVRPIYMPGSEDQMRFFEMPYSDRADGCSVDAAVMSF
jgi:hypothetical protein